MERKKALRVIIMSILVSYTVCKGLEEQNHLIPEPSEEVTGSAIHADVPLRTRQHKFPVQISTITDALSPDVEPIGSLDGRGLLTSKNVQKIKSVSAIRKLRHLARRHKVLKSSHGTGMHSSASILKNGIDIKAFAYPKTSPSSMAGLPYKTEIPLPVKLMILPTQETGIPSADTADAESDWTSKQDNSTKQHDKKSAHGNGKGDNSSPHGEPRATGHEGSTRHAGTSAMPRHKMPVHPAVKASSGLRWKAVYDHVKLDDSKNGKHFKIKKKKSHSEDKEQVHTSSTAATVAGILAGILILFIFTGVRRLWRTLIKRWPRRRYFEFGPNFPSPDYSSELSEEEIIFDRSVMESVEESSKGVCPRTTPEASLGRSRSATSCYESTGQVTQEQKLWTLTDAPNSTPLSVVQDAVKESRKEEIVITMGFDDDEESSVKSESESENSLGEIIYTSQAEEMKNVTSDTIIDIMGNDNDNEDPTAINEKSNQGCRSPKDAEKAKVKQEVRWEDESTSTLDRGASTSNDAKIRAMNRKDYKTWKEPQKDVKMKKAQGLKARDVLQGVQAIRDSIICLGFLLIQKISAISVIKHMKRARRENFQTAQISSLNDSCLICEDS